MIFYLLRIKGQSGKTWAIQFECETQQEAEIVADDIGAEYEGEFIEGEYTDINVRRLIN